MCARPYVPSSPREPLLEAALTRSDGPDVRRRLVAWAAIVWERLGELGMCEGLVRAFEEPVPDDAAPGAPAPKSGSLRVVVARVEGRDGHAHGKRRGAHGRAEAPRAHIALAIDEDHVEVAAELSPQAVSQARARIADPVRALELTTALESLPEQFALGIVADGELAPASHATTDQLRSLFERAEREERSVWLGWRIPRDVAVAHAALLEEQLEDAVVVLGDALAVLAAAYDPAPGMRVSRGRRAKKHRAASRDDEGRGAKRRALAREDEAEGREEPLAEPEPEPERLLRTQHRMPSGHPKARASARGRAGRRGAGNGAAVTAPLEKGARVRVLEGAFAGKVGTVQELDGKGGARVMLGLLAVRLDVRDLARCTEGRQRPMLSSSHRKPPLVRS